MTISLSDAGKRFNREWIFRHFTYTFEAGKSYAIVGPNGSGKSTLLQVISGAIHVNEGSLKYESGERSREFVAGSTESGVRSTESGADSREPCLPAGRSIVDSNNAIVAAEKIYSCVAICAPYLEVVEEMTLTEFFAFHTGFKPFLPGLTIDKVVTMLGLEKSANKQIRYYSSGMKQRVKLAQCILSDVPVVLLDEPCTNLDTAGIELYHQLIGDHCSDRLVIVSSNDEVEYRFCKEKIHITDYK